MKPHFQLHTYRDLIKSSLLSRKRFDPTITAQKVAEAARVQKAYFSKVMAGNADLNSDQFYLIARFFEWDSEETEYALLLLELARSSLADSKKEITKKVSQIQQKHLRLDRTLGNEESPVETSELVEYYLQPWTQLVHVALSIPRYAKNPTLLSDDLRISPKIVAEALRFLIKRKFITEHANKTLTINRRQIHLSKDSEYFRPWQLQLRSQALHRLHSMPQEEDYNFQVVFSADESSRQWIQKQFLEMIGKIKDRVSSAKETQVYNLSFDLFQWTPPAE